MNKGWQIILSAGLALATLLTNVSPGLAQSPDNSPDNNPSAQPAFVPGELLVQFKPGLSTQSTEQKVAEVQGRVVDRIDAIDTIKIEVPVGEELSSLTRLQQRSDVAFVEPNYIAYAQDIPDDPYYGTQWGMDTIGLPDLLDVTMGNSDVVVAVVDSGIDLDHPDFLCTVGNGQNKLTSGATFVSGTSTPNDDHSHGTHVAGIIGACTNNFTGVAGVAPNVRLMPVKVLNSNGNGTYADVAAGITYAVDADVDIINLSLGGTSGSSSLYEAVRYAYDNGVLVVAASGNYGQSSLLYPAAYSEAMAVGATNRYDSLASFSNYGSGLSVVAPGDAIYSTVPSGSYSEKSGTSMATPFVAGLAAMIWGMSPGLSRADVQGIIEDTAVDLEPTGKDIYFGYGRIDAYAAIASLLLQQFQLPVSENIVPQVNFLLDDETIADSSSIELPTTGITWQAALTPTVSWAEITDLGVATSENVISLSATRPITYGKYQTNLLITGTTTSQQQVGPILIENAIAINYIPQIQRAYLPVIARH
jgi:thermitase